MSQTPTAEPELRELNGWPALVFWQGHEALLTLTLETDGEVIHALHVVANPEKLSRLSR